MNTLIIFFNDIVLRSDCGKTEKQAKRNMYGEEMLEELIKEKTDFFEHLGKKNYHERKRKGV